MKEYELKSHQREAIYKVTQFCEEKNQSGFVSMAPGTGKTLVLLGSINKLKEIYPNTLFVIISSLSVVVRQTKLMISKYFPDLEDSVVVDTTKSWVSNEKLHFFPDRVLSFFGQTLHYSDAKNFQNLIERLNFEVRNFVYFTETLSEDNKASAEMECIFKYDIHTAFKDGNLLPAEVHQQYQQDKGEAGLTNALSLLIEQVNFQNTHLIAIVCKNKEQIESVKNLLVQSFDEIQQNILTIKTRREAFNFLELRYKYILATPSSFEGLDIPQITDLALFHKTSDSNLSRLITKVIRPFLNKTKAIIWDFYNNDFSKFPFLDVKYIRKDKVNRITPWETAFTKLRQLLIQFYFKLKGESGNTLFELCLDDKQFRKNNSWFTDLINNTQYKSFGSLDPIHVFSSISDANLSSLEKTFRLNNWLAVLERNMGVTDSFDAYEELSFIGCTELSTELLYESRNDEQQHLVWKMFHDSIYEFDLGIKKSVIELVKTSGTVDLRNFSILLYLIKPNHFLPVNKQTIDFLKQQKKLDREPLNVGEYNQLLVKGETRAYKLIAQIANNEVDINSLDKFDSEELKKYLGNTDVNFYESTRNRCKLLAIRVSKDCKSQYRKSLTPEEVFKFYSSFELGEGNILYNSELEKGVFDLERLRINISSVVGKNGTGKSTLIELLLIAFNNIAYAKYDSQTGTKQTNRHNLKWVEGIYLDFWFETDALYRVSLRGNDIKICSFTEHSKNEYVEDKITRSVENFNDSHFFYSLNINYSLHALNSEYQGEWLSKLFHKNDSYQTPILVEPQRKKGNVDVNVQESLVKQRLLANLLLIDTSNDKSFSLRTLKEGVEANYISLILTDSKCDLNDKNGKRRDLDSKYKKDILTAVLKEFLVEDIDINHLILAETSAISFACRYIIKKLHTIAKTYQQFSKFYDHEEELIKLNRLRSYCASLYKDNSHITFKLRQAINSFKYSLYIKQNYSKIDLTEQSLRLKTIVDNDKRQRLEYLLPPPFFKVQIHLKSGVEFSALSSGEKQKIYVINSILYHIRNLNSVNTEKSQGLTNFNYVNIFLDEIELCFHPELQRTFIADIRQAFEKLNLEYIYGINFCFITHSPFLLSDIPTSSILFLESLDELTTPVKKSVGTAETFAANIHDLLSDGFFMNSSIGAFAEEKIREIVSFHQTVMDTTEENIEILRSDFEKNIRLFEFIRDSISDSYVRGVVSSHLKEVIKKFSSYKLTLDEKAKRIKLLEEELDTLKGS